MKENTEAPGHDEVPKGWNHEVADLDLKKYFPRSVRSILRNWFPFLGIFLIAFIIGSAGLISLDYLTLGDHVKSFFTAIFERFITIALIGAVIGLIWSVLFYITYKYRILKGALVTRKGVIWRQSGIIPLHAVSDIELSKNFGDLIFFVERLQFMTSSPNATQPVIDGLSHAVAERLRNAILELSGKLAGKGEEAPEKSQEFVANEEEEKRVQQEQIDTIRKLDKQLDKNGEPQHAQDANDKRKKNDESEERNGADKGHGEPDSQVDPSHETKVEVIELVEERIDELQQLKHQLEQEISENGEQKQG